MLSFPCIKLLLHRSLMRVHRSWARYYRETLQRLLPLCIAHLHSCVLSSSSATLRDQSVVSLGARNSILQIPTDPNIESTGILSASSSDRTIFTCHQLAFFHSWKQHCIYIQNTLPLAFHFPISRFFLDDRVSISGEKRGERLKKMSLLLKDSARGSTVGKNCRDLETLRLHYDKHIFQSRVGRGGEPWMVRPLNHDWADRAAARGAGREPWQCSIVRIQILAHYRIIMLPHLVYQTLVPASVEFARGWIR